MNDASNPRSSGGGRPAVDLDELERQLRQMAAARPAGGSDAVSDLTRIMDRSDPVRAVLRGSLADERPAPPSHQPSARVEPAFSAPIRPEPVAPEPDYPEPLRAEYVEPAFDPAPAPLRPSIEEERDALVRAAQEDAVAALERAFAQELLNPPAAAPAPAPQVQPSIAAAAPVAAAVVPAREALEAFLRRDPAQPSAQPGMMAAAERAWQEPEPAAWPNAAPPHAQPHFAEQEPRFTLPEPEPDIYPGPSAGGHAPQDPVIEPVQDMRPLARRRGGKGMMIAASMLGIGVIGLVLAFAFRSDEPSAPSGQPPVVRADDAPAKVAPANPGGLDIPNQNKQIYEPAQRAAPGSSNVVTTTEQPVDLNQVVRSQPRVVLPGQGGATDAPPADAQAQPANPVNQLLGEPRRVKTVAVRPDGTIIATDSPASLAPAPAAPAAAAPRAAAPATTGAATPAPAEAARNPGTTGTTGGNLSALATAAAVPLAIGPGAAADASKNQQRITAPAPAPRALPPVAQPAAQQPAPATPPQRVAAAPAAAPATQAPAASGGGFAVQLAAPGSEQEARATYAALQRRFPGDLGSYAPIVRRAEVGNRTIYRLRVGPMDRAGAVALCERLKAGGGQCFVAANN